jgi:hypothetical protein
MVDVTLIKDTINELLEANVDKETIYQTLKDIGVDDSEIDKYYKESISDKIEKSKPVKEEPIANKDTEDHTNSEIPRREKVPRAKPKTTTEDLEKATEDISDSETFKEFEKEEPVVITKTIEIDNTNSEIKKQISELETQLSDIKAQINGLTKIMKDILEENRNILNRLK